MLVQLFNEFSIKSIVLKIILAFSVSSFSCYAQKTLENGKLITTKQEYLNSIKGNPQKKIVEIKKMIPNIIIDMPYSTAHNFTKTILYKSSIAMMRNSAANALINVQKQLNAKGLGLKIFDAYRPYNVTCKMWKYTTDRHYVANPKRGSNHNRGLALDLTNVELKTGKELNMGTGFDSFIDSAAHTFNKLPTEVLQNRKLLRDVMRSSDFSSLPNEWWHYTWKNTYNYEFLDIDFQDLLDE